MRDQKPSYPEDIGPVEELLKQERPTPAPHELEAIHDRVLMRSNRPTIGRKQATMRSRIMVLAALVLGFGLSTTGAGLAVTGFADTDRADVAQYEPAPTPPVVPDGEVPDGGGVLPDNDEGAPDDEDGGVIGESPTPPPADVQPARQVDATQGGTELPFTGFAAIPVLLLGFALLTAGLVARRSARDE
jgi:hypothetical protein